MRGLAFNYICNSLPTFTAALCRVGQYPRYMQPQGDYIDIDIYIKLLSDNKAISVLCKQGTTKDSMLD